MDTDCLYTLFACAFLGIFVVGGLAIHLYDRFVQILQTSHPDTWHKVGAPQISKEFEPVFDRKVQVPVVCIFALHRKLARMPPLEPRLKWLLVSTEVAIILLCLLFITVFVLVRILPI